MTSPPEADAASDEQPPLQPQVVDENAKPEGGPEEGTYITEPAKLIRIASMTRAMLEEVRQASLDEGGSRRLVSVYHRSIDELKDVLSDDLKDELDSIFIQIEEEETPSESELRIAQAQLIGWLEGLFHGIQASVFSQQLAATAQLEEMSKRRALEATKDDGSDSSGLYL